MKKFQQTIANINQLALDIVVPYQTLTFQIEFDKTTDKVTDFSLSNPNL